LIPIDKGSQPDFQRDRQCLTDIDFFFLALQFGKQQVPRIALGRYNPQRFGFPNSVVDRNFDRRNDECTSLQGRDLIGIGDGMTLGPPPVDDRNPGTAGRSAYWFDVQPVDVGNFGRLVGFLIDPFDRQRDRNADPGFLGADSQANVLSNGARSPRSQAQNGEQQNKREPDKWELDLSISMISFHG